MRLTATVESMRVVNVSPATVALRSTVLGWDGSAVKPDLDPEAVHLALIEAGATAVPFSEACGARTTGAQYVDEVTPRPARCHRDF